MSSASNGNKQNKKSYIALKVIGIVFSVLIVVSVITYVVIANTYKEKFIEGTKINNFDVSNMKPEEVEETYEEYEDVEDYEETEDEAV